MWCKFTQTLHCGGLSLNLNGVKWYLYYLKVTIKDLTGVTGVFTAQQPTVVTFHILCSLTLRN